MYGIRETASSFSVPSREHHDDEAVKELAESIIVAPDYVTTKIKDSEWSVEP